MFLKQLPGMKSGDQSLQLLLVSKLWQYIHKAACLNGQAWKILQHCKHCSFIFGHLSCALLSRDYPLVVHVYSAAEVCYGPECTGTLNLLGYNCYIVC